ncbi:hypothetical protein XSR1_170056 [Xenorhabdus szentirmaii DSM 16338]|uniref:Uncharacterized protein n=1 Tax=Xenorhabdus szentirmaii DSM 16338 TaxID=1427518 RepID=W1IU33_9GAMM|nr:hypothetical protein XSR1_170056 [Xenorhabdus szentirmaii DSM 16338]
MVSRNEPISLLTETQSVKLGPGVLETDKEEYYVSASRLAGGIVKFSC